MRRGFNNTFYFVESDMTHSSDILYELKIEFEHGNYDFNLKRIHELNSGCVIALEMDPDNKKMLDTGI